MAASAHPLRFYRSIPVYIERIFAAYWDYLFGNFGNAPQQPGGFAAYDHPTTVKDEFK